MGGPAASGLAHMAALAGVNGRLPDPVFLRGDPHAAALQGVLARGGPVRFWFMGYIIVQQRWICFVRLRWDESCADNRRTQAHVLFFLCCVCCIDRRQTCGMQGRSPVLQPELAAASVAPQHTRSPHLTGEHPLHAWRSWAGSSSSTARDRLH